MCKANTERQMATKIPQGRNCISSAVLVELEKFILVIKTLSSNNTSRLISAALTGPNYALKHTNLVPILAFRRHIGKREDPGDEVGSTHTYV